MLPEFESGRNFGVWLRGIARNKLKQHFERITRQATSLELFRSEVMAIDRMAEEIESLAERTKSAQMMAMVQCIAKLPDRMRMVVRGRIDGEKAACLAAWQGAPLEASRRAELLARLREDDDFRREFAEAVWTLSMLRAAAAACA